MSAETLISELLDLPEQVHRGDFVLNLSEGVTADHAEATLRDYVVTPQLADCFDDALGFIRVGRRGAQQQGGLPARQLRRGQEPLHGRAAPALAARSPPCGRSEDLAQVCAKHGWVEGKKFLLVPYHMIGARNMESAILGGYVDHVRRVHPDAPWPGVYLADDLFENAAHQRERLGDEKFFAEISQGRPAGRSGARSARAWDRRAVRGRGGGPARRRARAAGWSATWSSTSSPPTRASRGARPRRSCRSTRA